MSANLPSIPHHHFPGHRQTSGDSDRALGTPATLTLPALDPAAIRKQSLSHLFSEIYSQGAKIKVKETGTTRELLTMSTGRLYSVLR